MAKWYSLKNIDKYPCAYRLIIGKRSNGKTYALCNKGLREFIKTGKKMAYIRRYRDDITAPNLAPLFNAQPLEKLTEGRYDRTIYRSRQFFLSDEEGTKSDVFCETFALNTWERSKGADRGEYSLIVFDEFITRDQYLKEEVNIFLNVISSLMRNRSGTPIYMIANTVSQFCPYFADFNIDVQHLKQGEIKQTRENVVIEYCTDNGEQASNYFAGFKRSKTDMITSGAWEIRDYAHLPDSYREYNLHCRFFVVLRDRKICGEIRSRGAALFLYFYPFTGEIKRPDKTIIYSRETSANPLHSQAFNIPRNAAHRLIYELIQQDRVYYSDNHTGEAVRAYARGLI